jgi:hypothetical protein
VHIAWFAPFGCNSQSSSGLVFCGTPGLRMGTRHAESYKRARKETSVLLMAAVDLLICAAFVGSARHFGDARVAFVRKYLYAKQKSKRHRRFPCSD